MRFGFLYEHQPPRLWSARTVAARLQADGEAAFTAFVRRSDDRLSERIAGSDPGLRILFSTMASRFSPDRPVVLKVRSSSPSLS